MDPWSENRLLKRALALYAGDHVLKHVLSKGDDALRAGWSPADATVLFADVAGFTMPIGPMTPDDLTTLVSSWLEVITSQVEKFGGTLDTYIGDAASAWWGPEHGAQQAAKACHCAKGMVSELEQLNARFRSARWPEPSLKFRIGINSGVVRLGTYGTAKRLRFTVVGDVVNLASRLCGMANREYQHSVLLSEFTRNALGADLPTAYLDTIQVHGGDEPVKVYAI